MPSISRALLAYERAIRLEPKEFAWRYLSGARDTETVRSGEGSRRVLGGFTPSSRLWARASLESKLALPVGRLWEKDSYKALLTEDPASAEALYGLARVKYALNDMSAAEDFYSRACRAYRTFGAGYHGRLTLWRNRNSALCFSSKPEFSRS